MKARVSIHRDFCVGEVDGRIYSAFLEHLGRAIYGGIYEPGHPTADPQGFRGDTLELVRALNLPLVRYPGGNFVSAYNWEDGVGPRDGRPVRLDYAWRTRETNEIGTDEFGRWCELADTEMMLAVNLGSRDLDAARSLLEYCNHPSGTYWSDLRIQNGRKKPYDVRVWCLGNEMDGPWQVGHKTPYQYGRIANETAKAMRQYDSKLELVVCGSSHSFMPTYPEWEATVLDQCYDAVDYVSLHMYFENYENNYLNFMAKSLVMDRYIQTVSGVIDYVKAKKRSKKDIYICFDEWNVWYHNRRADHDKFTTWNWPVAPPLLEEVYNFEDVLLVGCILNTFIRRADRVKIACIAQLINVIAPIMTETGGPAWKQTIYYPLYFASLYGRGEALAAAVDVATYDADAAADVPYLDVAAVRNEGGKTITLFMVNRHPDETITLDVSLAGFAAKAVAEHITIADSDLLAANTAVAPNRVKPKKGRGVALQDGALKGRLAPRSYHVLRVTI